MQSSRPRSLFFSSRSHKAFFFFHACFFVWFSNFLSSSFFPPYFRSSSLPFFCHHCWSGVTFVSSPLRSYLFSSEFFFIQRFFSCFLRLLILSLLLPFMFFLHSFCRPFSLPSFRHPSCRGITFFRFSLIHFFFSVPSSSALFVVSLRHMQSCLRIQNFQKTTRIAETDYATLPTDRVRALFFFFEKRGGRKKSPPLIIPLRGAGRPSAGLLRTVIFSASIFWWRARKCPPAYLRNASLVSSFRFSTFKYVSEYSVWSNLDMVETIPTPLKTR